MPLFDDLEHPSSLVNDILKTFGSTALTFGAHAIKGATLGLVDPTQEAEEYLGSDIYRAAPKWARTGAEIVGETAPVMGSLGAARRLLPGVGVLPRAAQGFLAGASLGTLRHAIGGEDVADILTGGLTEGLIFGGIEGLLGLPETLSKTGFNKLRARNEALYKAAEEAAASAHTPDIENASEDLLASIRSRSADAPRWAGERALSLPPQPPKGLAELVSQQTIRDALQHRFTDPITQTPMHELWRTNLIFQTPKGEYMGQLMGAGKLEGKTGEYFAIKLADGTMQTLKVSEFLRSKNLRNRIFVGDLRRQIVPPNPINELLAARKDVGKLVAVLRKRGQLSTVQAEEFFKYVHPNAKGLKDLADWQLRRVEQLIQQSAAGKGLPPELFDIVGPIGKEVGEAQLGALAYAQPARWAVEAMSRKMGGATWPTKIYEKFLEMGEERRMHKMYLYRRVDKILEGLNKKQMVYLYQMDKEIRDATKGVVFDKPKFRSIKLKVIDKWVASAEKRWGPEVAATVKRANARIRALFDAMQSDLAGEGLLERYRKKAAYWPLLEADVHPVNEMFPVLPKEVRAFLQFPRNEILTNPETNVLKLLDAYIEAYTKLLHTKRAVDFMRKTLEGRKISPGIRKWFEHFSARQYGLPSQWDFRMAESMKSLHKAVRLNKLPHWMGGKYFKNFTTKDWVRLGVFFNDLPYYAHLGLRPFSAARNLLQPFLTTGPMIGNRWLARGYQEAWSKKARDWIRGANYAKKSLLQQSLGEWERRLHLEKTGKDHFANWMMGLFRKSDEINRFASGLGFKAKFDHFFTKIGAPNEEFFTKIKLRRFKASTRTEIRNLAKAYRAQQEIITDKLGEHTTRFKELSKGIERWTGREYHHVDNTLDRLRRQMRFKMVGDAIGDTQWLYGKEHAPIFTHAAGAIGRAGGVYQTWWLNYAQWTANLMRNTMAGGDYMPLATALANNAMIAMGFLAAGWESSKIWRTIGAGPFPTKLPFMGEMPPGIEPVYRLGESAANLLFKGDVESAEKRFNIFLKRAWDNWMPGSLVMKELARVGWWPQIVPKKELRLTPKATESWMTREEKILSVVGGRGRK